MVALMLGQGTRPLTFSVRVPFTGSLLVMITVPVSGFELLHACDKLGLNVTGNETVASAVSVNGRLTARGKKLELVWIFLMTRAQERWLVIFILCVYWLSSHAFPYLPSVFR